MDYPGDDDNTKGQGGEGENAGKRFCNSIGCPNGRTPIPSASKVECSSSGGDGNECEVEQCCEAFCSFHPCPNDFVPIDDAGSIKCTDNECSTEQCCKDTTEFSYGYSYRL